MKQFLKQILVIVLLADLAFGAHTVGLAWNAPVPAPTPALTSYKVYRGACGHETFFVQVTAPAVTYADTSVVNAHTYCYYVTDVNTNGESIASNEVSVTIPGVVTSVPSINFPRQLVGSTSAASDVTITNQSGSTVTIQDDGAGCAGICTSGDFAQTNAGGSLPISLANNATLVIHTTFTPTASGTRTGQLTINTSDGSSAHVTLSGTGGAPTPTVVTGLQTDDVNTPFPMRTQAINAAWVNGVAPGYKPENCGGLTLCLGSGLMADGSGNATISIRNYTGTNMTMTGSTTNYIFLDHTQSYAPNKNTTGFTCPDIPIALVSTSSGSISNVTDVRSATFFITCHP